LPSGSAVHVVGYMQGQPMISYGAVQRCTDEPMGVFHTCTTKPSYSGSIIRYKNSAVAVHVAAASDALIRKKGEGNIAVSLAVLTKMMQKKETDASEQDVYSESSDAEEFETRAERAERIYSEKSDWLWQGAGRQFMVTDVLSRPRGKLTWGDIMDLEMSTYLDGTIYEEDPQFNITRRLESGVPRRATLARTDGADPYRSLTRQQRVDQEWLDNSLSRMPPLERVPGTWIQVPPAQAIVAPGGQVLGNPVIPYVQTNAPPVQAEASEMAAQRKAERNRKMAAKRKARRLLKPAPSTEQKGTTPLPKTESGRPVKSKGAARKETGQPISQTASPAVVTLITQPDASVSVAGKEIATVTPLPSSRLTKVEGTSTTCTDSPATTGQLTPAQLKDLALALEIVGRLVLLSPPQSQNPNQVSQ